MSAPIVWAPGVTDEVRMRSVEVPVIPTARGLITPSVFGRPMGRHPTTGFAVIPSKRSGIGRVVGYTDRSVWVDPGAASSIGIWPPSTVVGGVQSPSAYPVNVSMGFAWPRFTAKRDACGFLLCGECNQPSPYAEPHADGSFTCRGCLIMREASR